MGRSQQLIERAGRGAVSRTGGEKGQQAPQRVRVHGRRDDTAFGELGRAEARRVAGLVGVLGARHARAHGVAQADHLHGVVQAHDDVRGAEVAQHEARRVQLTREMRELPHDARGAREPEGSRLRDERLQRVPRLQLVDKHGLAVFADHPVEGLGQKRRRQQV